LATSDGGEVPLVRIFCCWFNPYNAAIVKGNLFGDTIIGKNRMGGFKTLPFLLDENRNNNNKTLWNLIKH
jgi:hypothetical protein